MRKRLLSLLLAIVLLQTVFPALITTVDAADSITETEVLERLLSAEKKWKNGAVYDDSQALCKQCFGFCRELFYYVFNASMPRVVSRKEARIFGPAYIDNVVEIEHLDTGYSLDSLKGLLSEAAPGDVLIASSTSTNHFMMIRSVAEGGSGVYVYDANSDLKNGIRTNRFIKAEDLRRTRPVAVTLYRYVNYVINDDAPTCTVTFDPNGGGVAQTRKTVTQGALIGTVPTPTREGYQFLGWYDRLSGTAMNITSNSIYIYEDTVLYAWWKPVVQTVTVTFNPNGGRVSQISKKVTNGSTYGSLPIPTREGYEFLGWFLTPSGNSAEITSMATVSLTGDTKIYARWEKQPCTEHDGEFLYWGTAHPHYNYYKCSVCGEVYAGNMLGSRDDCEICNPTHECETHSKGEFLHYGGSHPHYNYYECALCGESFKDGSTTKVDICRECNPVKVSVVCKVHTKGEMLYCESAHPHRNYYECSVCGEEFTDGVSNSVTSCEECWGEWSGWSAKKATTTSTRQVETKKVKVSDSYTEYRYGRYIDAKGAHDCWCGDYLESLSYVSGSAELDYSDWSTTRYSENGKGWSCGHCDADHIGVDKTGSDGRDWWAEYVLPGGESYYWEESRQVDATYVTMYRYRELS